MEINLKTSRRGFICRALVLFSGGFIAQLLSACGGSGYSSSAYTAPVAGGNCDANGTTLATTGVTLAHTHTVQITAGQILTANPGATFTTDALAGHSHPVTLTAPQYSSLQANTGISLSTLDGGIGHTHTVTFNCA